jgi:ferredoxin-like protein FixX
MDIKEIIEIFDNELIEKNKRYLILSQANKLLIENKIIPATEKSSKILKNLLIENGIPHAYQTSQKPKQWRIPLTESKIHLQEKKKNSKIQNKPKIVICPNCGINLTISKGILKESYLQCLNCYANFENPLQNSKKTKKQPNSQNQENFNISKKQKNWIIGIAILVALYIIGSLDKQPSKVHQIYTHPGEGYGVDENGEIIYEVRRNYDLDGNPLYDENDKPTKYYYEYYKDH